MDANQLSYRQIQDAVLGTRFPERDRANAKQWIADAYESVWEAADWTFKHVARQSLTVSAAAVSVPAAMTGAPRIYDDQGDLLVQLDQRMFDDAYASPTLGTGRPEAFALVGDQILFAPTPGGSYSFQISFRRGLAHRDSAGNTVEGYFTADSDYPLWNGHHRLLVAKATKTGLIDKNDPTYYPLGDEIGRMTLDMISSLAVEVPAGTTWMEAW